MITTHKIPWFLLLSFIISCKCFHIKTGYISTHYPALLIIYFRFFIFGDNIFAIDAICPDLWDNHLDWYTKPEYEDRPLVYKQLSLDEVCIDDTDFRNSK